MTSKFSSNPLLLTVLVLFIGYWPVGYALPGWYMTAAGSVLLMIFGSWAMYDYGRRSYQIVFLGERHPRDSSAHYGVLAVFFIALGAVYMGTFAGLWLYYGQPKEWLSTYYSAAGRWIMAGGFGLMVVSPDITSRGVRLPGGLWVAAFFSLACLAALFVGVRLGWYQAINCERGDTLLGCVFLPHP